jgi:type I restriction enzyme S subunit
MKGILLRSAVLTTQLNLNYVRIGTNYAPFPPKKGQEEIAFFLDSKMNEIEGIRRGIEAQIATLTAYRKSLIHECVTGQRRITEADLQRAARGERIGLEEPINFS